jgi:hypothetical protein
MFEFPKGMEELTVEEYSEFVNSGCCLRRATISS